MKTYQSCRLYVNNTVRRTWDVGELVGEYAGEAGLGRKDAQHLVLLMEETIGMVSNMVGPFEAEIWLEGNETACKICLEAQAAAAVPDRERPQGFMAGLGQLLRCSYLFDGREEVPEVFMDAFPPYIRAGFSDKALMMGKWSLSTCREELRKNSSDGANDELEMSIVANLADDVTVGIQGDKIRLVISKNFRA